MLNRRTRKTNRNSCICFRNVPKCTLNLSCWESQWLWYWPNTFISICAFTSKQSCLKCNFTTETLSSIMCWILTLAAMYSSWTHSYFIQYFFMGQKQHPTSSPCTRTSLAVRKGGSWKNQPISLSFHTIMNWDRIDLCTNKRFSNDPSPLL